MQTDDITMLKAESILKCGSLCGDYSGTRGDSYIRCLSR